MLSHVQQDNLPPTFKNELIIEREASLQLRPSLEALRREAQDLDVQIRQLQVRIMMMMGSNYNGTPTQMDSRVLLQQLKSVWEMENSRCEAQCYAAQHLSNCLRSVRFCHCLISIYVSLCQTQLSSINIPFGLFLLVLFHLILGLDRCSRKKPAAWPRQFTL